MRIAVTYENGEVFQHFGHAEQFKIYDVANGAVVYSQIVNTNGKGHGMLANFLAMNQVKTVICGGIGAGAKNALANADIKLYCGIIGCTDKAVNQLINGTLVSRDVECNHAHQQHCGDHQCNHTACI